MIQVVAILPLLVSIVCLFKFKGSILGTIAFFLLLIVGILLPQIYRDLIQSHLILKKEIEMIKKP
jgi:mannose/fructose/N-acetylgalactosamine-specific phosphotransferase system component IID